MPVFGHGDNISNSSKRFTVHLQSLITVENPGNITVTMSWIMLFRAGTKDATAARFHPGAPATGGRVTEE